MTIITTEQDTQDFPPIVEIKEYNAMIDGENLLHQPTQNDLRTYDNNRKIVSGQGDNYTTGSLIDYPYFKEHYNLIVMNSSKQQTQDADPNKIPQIHFTGKLYGDGNSVFFIIEEKRETILDFLTKNCWSIVILFCFHIMSV